MYVVYCYQLVAMSTTTTSFWTTFFSEIFKGTSVLLFPIRLTVPFGAVSATSSLYGRSGGIPLISRS